MLRSIVHRSQLRSPLSCYQYATLDSACQVARYSQAAGTENVEAVLKPREQVYILKKRGRTPLHLRLKRLSKKRNQLVKLKPARYKEVEPPQQPPVATLAHGLDRVLFNPGIHYMKDPRTHTYNFPKFLEDITQPSDFDYEALQPYITSSKDQRLAQMARDLGKRYVGSTSSVTAVLSHFYFALSNNRPVDTSVLSQAFASQPNRYTRGAQLPASIYLRWKDGVYAIDVDKSFDVEETILSIMGKSLEKVLTLSQPEYERYLKASETPVSDEERRKPETYAFGQFGNFLLRSQLDCQDPRLPRRTFDLKTRAAIPVRLDLNNYQEYLGYSLRRSHGLFESFEREYYDMMRSAFLKYNFQVRIGHMDGILVAYHNTRKIFGFQYISREEMDARLFGSRLMGDQAFHHCLALFDVILTEATNKFPQQTLRLSFDSENSRLSIFVEPVPKSTEPPVEIPSEGDIVADKERSTTEETVTAVAETESTDNMEDQEVNDDDKGEDFFKTDDPSDEAYDGLRLYTLDISSYLNGTHQTGPFTVQRPTDRWTVRYRLRQEPLSDQELRGRFQALRKQQKAIMVRKDLRGPLAKLLKTISERSYEIERRRAK